MTQTFNFRWVTSQTQPQTKSREIVFWINPLTGVGKMLLNWNDTVFTLTAT